MPYNPIEDHAVIGNLHTIALVSLQGSIDFMCLPRFDAPTVFAKILDDKIGGCFSIACGDEHTKYKQLYLPGTNILITRYLSQQGIAELTDFMPIAKRENDFAIYRRLKGVHGDHTLRVRIDPRYDYARQKCRIERASDGSGYLLHDPNGEQPTMVLETSAELEITEDGLEGEIKLKQGENIDFLLTLDEGRHYAQKFLPAFQECRKYWTQWASRCKYKGLWKEEVLRSALALKLLTSAPFR